MENQVGRENLAGRSRPGEAFGEPATTAGIGSGGWSAESGSPISSSATGAGADFAGAFPEQAGVKSQPGTMEGQSSGESGAGSGGTMARVDAGLEKAAGGIDKLVGAIRDRSEEMEGSTGATGTVGSMAATAADKLEGASQYLHQTDTDRLIADLESLIRRKPAQSLLVAAGLGFVFAKALR
jgi:hypothetical protein